MAKMEFKKEGKIEFYIYYYVESPHYCDNKMTMHVEVDKKQCKKIEKYIKKLNKFLAKLKKYGCKIKSDGEVKNEN